MRSGGWPHAQVQQICITGVAVVTACMGKASVFDFDFVPRGESSCGSGPRACYTSPVLSSPVGDRGSVACGAYSAGASALNKSCTGSLETLREVFGMRVAQW